MPVLDGMPGMPWNARNAGMLERNDILAPVTLSYSIILIFIQKKKRCVLLVCYSVWIIAPIKI